jgi:hypothetical protein
MKEGEAMGWGIRFALFRSPFIFSYSKQERERLREREGVDRWHLSWHGHLAREVV